MKPPTRASMTTPTHIGVDELLPPDFELSMIMGWLFLGKVTGFLCPHSSHSSEYSL